MYDNGLIKKQLLKKLREYPEEYEKRFNVQNFKKQGSKYINNTPCPHCTRFLNGLDCGQCPLEKTFGVGEGLHGMPGCMRAMQAIWGPLTFIDSQQKIISNVPNNAQLCQMYNDMTQLHQGK